MVQSESHHHEFETLAQHISAIEKTVKDVSQQLLTSEKWYVDFKELPEDHVTVRLYDEHNKSLYQQEPSVDDTWYLELQ